MRRVRVLRDAFFANGRLKVQAGAVGLEASMHEGRTGVTFEYHDNGNLFIAKDGGGRKSVDLDTVDLHFEMEDA